MSTLFKRGDIYWYAVSKDGKQYPRSLKTKDKSEAQYLRAKLDQENVENPTPFSKIRCQTALGQYCEAMKQRCTHEYSQASKRRINELLGKTVFLDQIAEPEIITHLNTRKGEYDHNNSVSALKAFFKWCVKSGYLQKSPADNIKKINIQESPRESFSHKQIKAILDKAKKEEVFPAIVTALHTGMRRSELFGLTWTSVDMSRRLITLAKTKNRRVRIIPMHQNVFNVLKPLQAKEGLVFSLSNERRAMKRIFKAAEVEGNWHHFRHTFITHLLRSGVDLKTVSTLAGHSSVSVTSKYLSTTPDHMKKAVNLMQF